MKRVWSMQQPQERTAETLRDALGISPVVADILAQRGFGKPEAAIDFLRPSLLNSASPFDFRDMRQAVERLANARDNKEKVLIYGDYDVDGVTSTTLLYQVLVDLGFTAVAYIPHRQDEGYGLHSEAIERAAKADVRVIITVDCGITAAAEVDLARRLGMDVIITDHHEPPATLPDAFALINPKVSDAGYPFRDLAGVGVAFKLAQALLQMLGNHDVGSQSEIEILDLVALGSIADLVPLVGENRIFVHYGLRQMEETVHLGLEALLEECGLKNKSLKAGQIAFMVAPRINAAGRMDSARAGLELLLTGDAERAKNLARQLTRENQQRQETEKEILAEAISALEKNPLPRVIVLSAKHWHHGVIGIVASRLVERYYRPVFMIAEEGEEAKGSARGIPGYHVLEQLTTQGHILSKYGGHRQAAGFSLPTQNIDRLREGLNDQAADFGETLFQEVLNVDRQVSLDVVSEDLLRELEQLAPFGFGNPGPTLAAERIPVYSLSPVGQDQSHLKFRFGASGEWEGIAFRQGERMNELNGEAWLDAAFSLDWNTYQGKEKVQFIIKDIHAEADWRKGQSTLDDHLKAIQETAAVFDEGDVEWLDWRHLDREAWHLPEFNEFLWIWDTTGIMPQLQRLNGSDKREQMLNLQHPLQDKREDVDRSNGLGLIFGLPLTEEDLIEGIETLRQLGVVRIALAGFQPVDEERVHQRCGYFTRETLIDIYRELLAKSEAENPFYWNLTAKSASRGRDALKIFEELGLLRCLGGTERVVLNWIPAERKLNLEASLRFRSAKERVRSALNFQHDILEVSLDMFARKWKI